MPPHFAQNVVDESVDLIHLCLACDVIKHSSAEVILLPPRYCAFPTSARCGPCGMYDICPRRFFVDKKSFCKELFVHVVFCQHNAGHRIFKLYDICPSLVGKIFNRVLVLTKLGEYTREIFYQIAHAHVVRPPVVRQKEH